MFIFYLIVALFQLMTIILIIVVLLAEQHLFNVTFV